jgi:hypothetical protein
VSPMASRSMALRSFVPCWENARWSRTTSVCRTDDILRTDRTDNSDLVPGAEVSRPTEAYLLNTALMFLSAAEVIRIADPTLGILVSEQETMR